MAKDRTGFCTTDCMWNSARRVLLANGGTEGRTDAGKSWKCVCSNVATLSSLIPRHCFAEKGTSTPNKRGGGLSGIPKSERRRQRNRKKFGPPRRSLVYVFAADAAVRSHVEADICCRFCSNTVSNESVAQLDGVIIASQVQASVDDRSLCGVGCGFNWGGR